VLEELQGMAQGLDGLLSSVEPALLHPYDAVRALEAATAVETRAASLKTLVAARAADAQEWRRRGYRSPEEWLAQEMGTGWSQAAGTLDASEKLKELPALDDAVRQGELSPQKLQEVAKAATPKNERELVKQAKKQSLRQLKRTCAAERAKTRSDEAEAARQRRIHEERFFRSWTDPEGAWRCEAKATAAVGARIDAAIAATADAIFKEAYAAGRREPMAAYRADALEQATCGGGARVDACVVVRVDEERLRGEGGVCETTTGPVPVHEAIGAILAGAFVKVVAHDGVDVTRVAHAGRRIRAEVKTAILERDGYRCVRPDCGSTINLEVHHYRIDHAKGGPTACWNLCCVCRHCHHLLTYGGHCLEGGPGGWTWIPPPP